MLLITDPRHRPLRSMVIVIAIASSMALFFTISSLTNGIKESSREAVEAVGADVYVVPEGLNPLLVDLQSFNPGWDVIRQLEGFSIKPSASSPRLKDTLFFGEGSANLGETLSYGIVPERESSFNQFRLIEGEWFGTSSDPVRDHYIATNEERQDLMTLELMVSEEFKRNNDLGPGDDIYLSSRMGIDPGIKFEITGVFQDSLSRKAEVVMLHLGELQLMKGLLHKDTLTEILLSYEDTSSIGDLITWSEGDGFRYNSTVDLYLSEDFLSEIYKFVEVLDGFSALVITVTFAVCLIFTSTVFMISAKERAVDLSVLRAIGFGPYKIFMLIMRESILLYISGALIGMLLGLAINMLLNTGLESMLGALPTGFKPFQVGFGIMILTLLSAFFLSIFSSLVPALISARRPPIEAIRGEI
ncbi:MAG: ABC transporter permease [Thermoplasmatota archaeon]